MKGRASHMRFYGHLLEEDLIARRLPARSRARLHSEQRASVRQAIRVGDRRRLSDPQTSRQSGAGCLLAALGPDVSRHSPTVRRTVTGYVHSALDLLATLVPGKSRAARRQKALGAYVTLVGAMVVARAVDDRALSQEILDAGLASVKG